MMKRRVVIIGAAGRDFHNFNMVFRDNPDYEVVAFLTTQIPNIDKRVYPPSLAGKYYPKGIPILSISMLEYVVKKFNIDLVVLSYSDITQQEFVELVSRVLALGPSFTIIGSKYTTLKSRVPVIAVVATRTGAGKSTVSRRISRILRDFSIKYVVIRHPMAYGELEKMVVQRFASLEDIDKHAYSIEEKEEYEPHVKDGTIVYAGVDYAKVLEQAEKEADVIIWDGGNNDIPFIKPDLLITVVDASRSISDLKSFPGLINLILADIIVINKVNLATDDQLEKIKSEIRKYNKRATIIETESLIVVDKPELIRGHRVLVVEDSPTVTHGGLKYCAGYTAAIKYGAKEIVDPSPYLTPSLKKILGKYEHLKGVLPTLGYGRELMKEFERVLNSVDCDTVVLGTQSEITRYIKVNKPVVKVKFVLKERGEIKLDNIIRSFLRKYKVHSRN